MMDMTENEVCINGKKVRFKDVREMIENHLMEAIFGRHFQRIYSDMNEYMENIFNSPSTVNRLLPYYIFGIDISKPNKRYIMFNGKIVREYDLGEVIVNE